MLDENSISRDSTVEEIVSEFCIDTNFLIKLYASYTKNSTKIQTLLSRDKCSAIPLKFLKLVKDKKVNVYITSTVLLEFYRYHKFEDYENRKRFLEEMGFKRISFGYFSEEVNKECHAMRAELVKMYTAKLEQEEKEKILKKRSLKITNCQALNNPAFTRKDKADARIMAEAVIAGVPLITLNTNHFIKRNRPEIISYLSAKLVNPLQAKPITLEGFYKILDKRRYPALREIIQQEVNAKNYPISNFAYCKKKVTDKNVKKLCKCQKRYSFKTEQQDTKHHQDIEEFEM